MQSDGHFIKCKIKLKFLQILPFDEKVLKASISHES